MIITADQLPIEQYHQGHAESPRWLSKTSLRDFEDHGASWWQQTFLAKTNPKQTPGGALQGNALDLVLTDPRSLEAFHEVYAVRPEGLSLATKEGKAWKETNEGKIAFTHDDYQVLIQAIAAVKMHPIWEQVGQCDKQLTCRRFSEGLGFGLQSRPDFVSQDRKVVFDLKKTRDLNIFGTQAINLGYHLQAAIAGWCLAGDGHQIESAYLLAVEWEIGARCRVYRIPEEILEHGHTSMRKIALEIKQRLASNDWTDTPPLSEALEVPGWMINNMQKANEQ